MCWLAESAQKIPAMWSQGWVTLIPKESDEALLDMCLADVQKRACAPANMRPITVLASTWRLFMKARGREIADWIDPARHRWQCGARCGKGIADAISATAGLLEAAMFGCTPLHGVTIDIRKCFDAIPWAAVSALFECHGLSGHDATTWTRMLGQYKWSVAFVSLASDLVASSSLGEGSRRVTL
eukprot:4904669-Amphidinium_carterae.1